MGFLRPRPDRDSNAISDAELPQPERVSDGKRILKGSAFVLVSRITSMVAMLVFSIYMARTLGRDLYGLISIAIGVFGIATIIGDLGLNHAMARYVPIHKKKGELPEINAILVANLVIKLLSGIVLTVFLIFLSPSLEMVFNKPVARLIAIMALGVLFNTLASAFQALARGYHRMDIFAGTNMARDVCWLVSSIYLVLEGFGVEGAVIGYIIGQVAWLAANIVAYYRSMHITVRPSSVRSAVREQLIFGLPLITGGIMTFLFNWTDTFMIGIFRETWEVSCYNVAFGMIDMVMVVIGSVSIAVLPIFSEMTIDKNPAHLTEYFNRLTKNDVVVVYPIITFIVFVQPYVMLIYGAQYLPGLMPLWILAVWGYFRPFGHMGNTMLTAFGRQKYVLYATTYMAVLNVILNGFLVPFFGMVGAAVASSISICIGCVLSVIYLRRLEAIKVTVQYALNMYMLAVVIIIPFILAMFVADIFVPFEHSLLYVVLVLVPVSVLYLVCYLYFARQYGFLDDQDVANLRNATSSIPAASRIIDALF